MICRFVFAIVFFFFFFSDTSAQTTRPTIATVVPWKEACRGKDYVCDCTDIRANGYTTSGVYIIRFALLGNMYYDYAYCDMTTGDGGWTVFQRRKDGSVDFYRGFKDYKNGFGHPEGEHWLGNIFICFLTSMRRYRLRVDLWDFEAEEGHRYAEYSTFMLGSPDDFYRLSIGEYSGNAGDGLRRHNNQQFSTKDSDHDSAAEGNCAVDRRGGWWYEACADSNLNGLYYRGKYTSTCSECQYEGIEWIQWHGRNYSLKATEMKIRAE